MNVRQNIVHTPGVRQRLSIFLIHWLTSLFHTRIAHTEQHYPGRDAAHDVLDIPLYTLQFNQGGKWHVKARLGCAIALQFQILYDSLAFFHVETATVISLVHSGKSALSEHQAIDILDELWRRFMFTYRLSRTLRWSARHNWVNIAIQKQLNTYNDED